MKHLLIVLLLVLPLAFPCAQDGSPLDSLQIDQAAADADSLIQTSDSSRKIDEARELLLVNKLREAEDAKEIAKLKAALNELREDKALADSALQVKMDSLRKVAPKLTVQPFDAPMFDLYAGIGAFSLRERVTAIEQRIVKLADDRRLDLSLLKTAETEGIYSISLGDITIMAVTDKDALWAGKPLPQLAEAYRLAIKNGIEAHLEATSVIAVLTELGLMLLVVAIVVALVILINRGYKRLRGLIEGEKDRKLKPFLFRDYELLSADQIGRAINLGFSLVRYTIILLVISFALPIIFSIFPVTEKYSMQILGYILTPLKQIGMGFVNFLPNLLTIVVIVIVTRYVTRFLRYLAKEVEAEELTLPGFFPDWAMPTFGILRFLVYAFMIVAIFPYLPGSDSAIFQGVTVFLGLLFSLGSSNAVSNIVAGLVITYMRPYKIGDRIKVGEVLGTVVEKSLLVTRLHTVKNEEITLPNAQVLNNHTQNFTSMAASQGLILSTTVTIGYDVPWKNVHAALIQAALKTERIIKDKSPFVLQTGLEDFYVSYQLNAFTAEPGRMAVIYSDLHANIQDALHGAGIEILSPHYRANRDGNQLTVPPEYVPEDYEPPAFRVKREE